MSRRPDIVDKIFTEARTTPLRLMVGVSIAYGQWLAYKHDVPARSSLPEPVDIGDHQGNDTQSLIGGMAVGHFVGRAIQRAMPEASPRTHRAALTTVAMAIGAIANAVVEYRVGHQVIGHGAFDVFGKNRQGSVLDVIYGSVASGAGSLAIVPVQEVSAAQEDLPVENRSYD